MSLPIYGIALLLLMLASPLALAKPECPGHPSCKDDGGGDDSDQNIPLSCFFMDAEGDNVMSDGGGFYVDGQQRVACSTGGTVQPNLSGIGLSTLAKGNVRKRERQLDMAFLAKDISDTTGLPLSIFEGGDTDPATFDMEDVWFSVRPYKDTQDHIQNLVPGVYEMALRMVLLPIGDIDYRIAFSMATRAVPGDNFQGVYCDAPEAPITDDVSVIVWGPEVIPNRFTVTTGQVNEETWEITHGARTAALCSDIPKNGVPCDNGLCNFMGFVDVQFTFHADDLP
jgi:hypothetical protein